MNIEKTVTVSARFQEDLDERIKNAIDKQRKLGYECVDIKFQISYVSEDRLMLAAMLLFG